jgi:hypothetical protein
MESGEPAESSLLTEIELRYLAMLAPALQPHEMSITLLSTILKDAASKGVDVRRVYEAAVECRPPSWPPAPNLGVVLPAMFENTLADRGEKAGGPGIRLGSQTEIPRILLLISAMLEEENGLIRLPPGQSNPDPPEWNRWTALLDSYPEVVETTLLQVMDRPVPENPAAAREWAADMVMRIVDRLRLLP